MTSAARYLAWQRDIDNSSQPANKLELMCSAVQRIIIENFNYCNRTCPFCVNSKIDRSSSKLFMPEEVFQNVLIELAAGSYSNAFAFGRYHEPLADDIIFERIRSARERLPFAHIFLNTNGDFVQTDTFLRLIAAGLDEIKIMQYLPATVPFTVAIAQEYCSRFLKRARVSAVLERVIEDELVYYRIDTGSELVASLRSENYDVRGCDRGGSLAQLSLTPRKAPCYSPYFDINIDYNGVVMPCCNLVSNLPEHLEYALGSLTENSLTEIYFGDRASKFRRAVGYTIPTPSTCTFCHYHWPKELNPMFDVDQEKCTI